MQTLEQPRTSENLQLTSLKFLGEKMQFVDREGAQASGEICLSKCRSHIVIGKRE